MPVLALGGEKSFGLTMAEVMRAAATNVTQASSRQRPLDNGRESQGDCRPVRSFLDAKP
jgi:hypothetical protein